MWGYSKLDGVIYTLFACTHAYGQFRYEPLHSLYRSYVWLLLVVFTHGRLVCVCVCAFVCSVRISISAHFMRIDCLSNHKTWAREHSSTQHSWIHNLQLIHSTCDGWRYRIWLKTWRTLTLSIFFGCCRSLFRCFLSIVMFGRRLAMEKSPNSDGAVCVCVCLLLAARFVHTTHFILLILDSVHRIK